MPATFLTMPQICCQSDEQIASVVETRRRSLGRKQRNRRRRTVEVRRDGIAPVLTGDGNRSYHPALVLPDQMSLPNLTTAACASSDFGGQIAYGLSDNRWFGVSKL